MAIIMTCIWALGTTFVSSGIVAFTVSKICLGVVIKSAYSSLQAWFAVVFYLYAVAKDFGNGKKYRSYNNYEQLAQTNPPMPTAPVPDFSNTTSALHRRSLAASDTSK